MPGFVGPFTSADHAGRKTTSATVETKRKHRWIFSVFWDDAINSIGKCSVYLQSAQRPHAVVEEATMHHDEEQAYFAGKYHWEPINLVFYDTIASDLDSSAVIWAWFNAVISVPNATVALPSAYKKSCVLNMTNGAGLSIESWKMYNCWPIDVNWNDLDYTNTEIQTIDVSMKMDRAEKAS